MWRGSCNTRFQSHLYATLPQLHQREICQPRPHLGENAVAAMQEDAFDALPGERRIVSGDGMYEIVELTYRFHPAESCSRHTKRQQLLASPHTHLHIPSSAHGMHMVA